jgi:hypothetical protein
MLTESRGDAMSEDGQSTRWVEMIPKDEAAQLAAFVRQMNRYQQGFARDGDGQAHRGFHVKSHAGLTAEFRVLDDIPAKAKHGVFKTGRIFPAWARMSNGFSVAQSDWFPDLVGLAVKLRGVEGPKLLDGEEHADSQDFLALNHRYVPADGPEDLVVISIAAASLLTAPFKMVRSLGWAKTLRIIGWTVRWTPRRILLRSVATEEFHSLSPITIGPHAVKYMWRPRQGPVASPPRASWRNYFRDDLRQRLAKGDIGFDFLAQFYVDEIKTPLDGAYAWKPEDAPFVKLAELTIHRRDLDSVEVKREEIYLAGVSFNPWHAIAEHRPLGNIQRARRLIYHASAKYRGRETDPVSE